MSCKSITLFALSALPIFALAQSREIVTDTTYLQASAGRFFQVRILAYDNGEASSTTTLIGDTTAVVRLYASRIAQEAGTFNAAARIIINRRTPVLPPDPARTDASLLAESNRLRRSP